MPKSKRPRTTAVDDSVLLEDLVNTLRAFGVDAPGLGLRPKVLRLVEILKSSREYFVEVVKRSGCSADDARERIRIYLVHNVGLLVGSMELEVVSGISEYGRRVRELRVEDGYQILTAASTDPDGDIVIPANQYLLIDSEPDREAAHRWKIANRIRRSKLGGKERILAYLKAVLNQIVTSEELSYVSGGAKEFGRRTRELRTEEGYAVATRFTGRPDLKSGQYVLESVVQTASSHDRHIPHDVQKKVFARDANTCVLCGWTHAAWVREDPRHLEVHHVEHHAHGGANLEENLVVLCKKCHDDVHAGRQSVAPPSAVKP